MGNKRLFFFIVVFFASAASVLAQSKAYEKWLQIQILLDKNNFAPGVLDGKPGEFTEKALQRYRAKMGKPGSADNSDLPLHEVATLVREYTITDQDMQLVGDMPETVEEKSKLPRLNYGSGIEMVAEKFHSHQNLILALNPALSRDKFVAETKITVPNIEPDHTSAKQSANDSDAASADAIYIDTTERILEVRKGADVLATFPISPGSENTPAPKGEWQIATVVENPPFRWDEKMLKEGERSEQFYMLPPGPNSPIGLFWLGLNKDGIGIHGTSEPETIGRQESHGCIRLANWDIAKLRHLVKQGTTVKIT